MISAVVPFHNEEESLKELAASLHRHLEDSGHPFEIVLVDDGSKDASAQVARELVNSRPGVTLVRLRRNHGKSAALAAGMEHTGGEVIITLDADLQDDPAEIPKLLNALDGGLDLVCGWRRPRRDPLSRRLQSLLYNLSLKMVGLGVVHDMNCGLRAMRREIVQDIPLYGERHRLIPLVANWQGFRVGEVVINHRPRKHGKSKYGPSRFPSALFDILTAFLLSRFYKKPSRPFAIAGALMELAGLAICSYIAYLRLKTGTIQFHYPLLALGVMLVVVGVQVLLTGFLSELIVYARGGLAKEYSVKEVVAHAPGGGKTRPSGGGPP